MTWETGPQSPPRSRHGLRPAGAKADAARSRWKLKPAVTLGFPGGGAALSDIQRPRHRHYAVLAAHRERHPVAHDDLVAVVHYGDVCDPANGENESLRRIDDG